MASSLKYKYVIPGLNQDQHQNIATKKASEHAKHAFTIEAEVPGDPTIVIRMQLQLSGTGTVFDQNYEITDVEHKASFDGGYITTIKGKTDGGSGGSGISGSPTPGASAGGSATAAPGSGVNQSAGSIDNSNAA